MITFSYASVRGLQPKMFVDEAVLPFESVLNVLEGLLK